MKETASTILSLFTSVGTLVCCALPALFVSLGMGMAVATLVSTVPWLVSFSRYKEWMFAGSGLMMALSFFLVYGLPRLRSSTTSCETGNQTACGIAGRFSRVTLWTSLIVYFVGFFMAYLFLPLKLYIENS